MKMIETSRLILRGFIDEDFEDYWEYYSQPLVREAAGLSPIDSDTFVWAKIRLDMKNVERFAIIYRPEMKTVGEIQLSTLGRKNPEFEGHNVREMSYMLNQDYHRRGIMTEAVKATLKHGFEDMKLEGVCLSCFARNIASLKLSLKCGFRFVSAEKVEHEHEMHTVFSMEMTQKEYFQAKQEKERAKERKSLTRGSLFDTINL